MAKITGKYKYSIYRPGGNDTALVDKLVLDPTLKKKINDEIMTQSPTVEQVGFVDEKNCRLEMAGGEFCGNAVRCVAYQFLNGQPGEILIKVSGVNRRLKAGIDRTRNAWAQMPVYSDARKITRKRNYWIVELEGITQVVYERQDKFISKEQAKKRGLEILKQLELLQSVSASGVIFLTKVNGQFSIEPIVWVRNIKTLFYETACASGTTAVGLIRAIRANGDIDKLRILQPSGMPIFATVKIKDDQFLFAKISGAIKKIRTLTIKI